MFSDTRKDYLEKGYAKVESFFSKSEISQQKWLSLFEQLFSDFKWNHC